MKVMINDVEYHVIRTEDVSDKVVRVFATNPWVITVTLDVPTWYMQHSSNCGIRLHSGDIFSIVPQ